jgi:hypothetical protein
MMYRSAFRVGLLRAPRLVRLGLDRYEGLAVPSQARWRQPPSPKKRLPFAEWGISVRPWACVAEPQTCAECGKQSPETETDYTLISAQYGWRLTRTMDRDGSLLLEWRCPSCWAIFKAERPRVGDGPPANLARPK